MWQRWAMRPHLMKLSRTHSPTVPSNFTKLRLTRVCWSWPKPPASRRRVVMSDLASTQTGEVGFRAIGAGTVDAIAVLVVDPLHGETGMQRVPGGTFIGVNHCALGDPQPDGSNGVRLSSKHLPVL